MRTVRCHPLASSTDVRVAETVAQHINQHSRQARLRIETIADEINKSERTVLRSLANLEVAWPARLEAQSQ
jgi:AraC-like DNA-binding protein